MCDKHGDQCELIFRPYITRRNGDRVRQPDGRMWPIHIRR